jgi:hypothetical protein
MTAGAMEVDKQRFEDAGEKDENGYNDYYCAGWSTRCFNDVPYDDPTFRQFPPLK